MNGSIADSGGLCSDWAVRIISSNEPPVVMAVNSVADSCSATWRMLLLDMIGRGRPRPTLEGSMAISSSLPPWICPLFTSTMASDALWGMVECQVLPGGRCSTEVRELHAMTVHVYLVLGIQAGAVVPKLDDTIVIVSNGVVGTPFHGLSPWNVVYCTTSCSIIFTPSRMLYPLWSWFPFGCIVGAPKPEPSGSAGGTLNQTFPTRGGGVRHRMGSTHRMLWHE